MGKSINSKKMFRNTFMLYVRQIVILVINLVSVRILLHSFGEDDYGLYTLIAGIASMFSILSGAMSSASQRFYSFYMGQDKYDGLGRPYLMEGILPPTAEHMQMLKNAVHAVCGLDCQIGG